MLQVRLFRRSTRAITLTDEGSALLAEAGPALDRVTEAALNASGEAQLRGSIRMTAPADFLLEAIAAAIADFRKVHPGVTFDLQLASATLDMVGEGIDLALRTGDQNPADMVLRPLKPFRYGFYASRGYLSRYPEPRRMKDDFDFLSPHAAIRGYLERHALAGRRLPQGSVQANSFTMLRELALCDGGVAPLPTALAEADVADGNLVEVLSGEFVAQIKMSLAFPSRADISPRLRLFAAMLADAIDRRNA